MRTTHFLTVGLMIIFCCSCNNQTLKQPALLGGKPLPEGYASPDGWTQGSDGYLYVSINQKAIDGKYPAKIARISPDDRIEDFFVFPANAKTGKTSPLGLIFAADGNMYVTDNQSFYTDEPNQSGIIRILMADGKPQGSELVVTGFNASNGITKRGNYLYVAETDLKTPDKYTSGVYRFALDELISGDTLTVTGIGDPHLILTFETKNREQAVGANGVAIDSKGNLYVNNFGDAEIMKYSLDEQGNIVSGELFCRPEGVLSLDGMQIDSEDNIWTTDFTGNAVIKVDTKTVKSSIIAKNASPVTGEKGELDSPSECIRRGNKVYVSNIDIASVDAIQTISVILLTE